MCLVESSDGVERLYKEVCGTISLTAKSVFDRAKKSSTWEEGRTAFIDGHDIAELRC